MKHWRRWVLLLAIFSGGLCGSCRGEDKLLETYAWRAIIGESSSQGYHGMLAVACGIRNRGSLYGVYGLNSPHIDKEPEWVWRMARKAGKESEHNRIHEGDCWGSNIVDKDWLEKMNKSNRFIKVYEYKNHTFFKEIK